MSVSVLLRFTLCLAAALFFLPSATVQADEPVRVTVIFPTGPDNPFWNQLSGFMQIAARQLNTELEIIHAYGNRFRTTEVARQVLQRPQPPQYLIYNYYRGQGDQILQMAEAAGVHSVIINTDIPLTDLASTGRPQEKYRYFLARIIPDDYQAGFDNATLLLSESQHLPLSADRIPLLTAINGNRDTTASLQRSKGLRDAVAHQQASLVQEVFANWSATTAARQTSALLQRHPQIRLIWAASDSMAIAAARAAADAGLQPGKDILLTGIDWSAEGIQAVRDGRLLATAGGHFMDGALALAVIYDHSHGHGPQAEEATVRHHMGLIQRGNLDTYQPLLQRSQWPQLNFPALSRTLGKRAHYPQNNAAFRDALLTPVAP
ncbi:MAG: ABC transporter substrate-binding protein [Pseudomonadota bacterium]|nr:ABC transporter substrate-binding protein [Pseudomonadota bacterium]